MKKTYNVFGLVIIFLFAGCINRQPENADILVSLNRYRHNKIKKTDSIYLNKTIKNDTLNFIYKFRTDTLAYSFFKPVDNDSSINLYGHKCPLVSNKTFKIKNREFTILKYFYDEESSSDEESSFFFQQDYGLLVVFNDGWLSLICSMEYDSISKILIDSIISDRTGFYLRKIPPPLPPPDSLMIEID